ncbi:MAG: UvrD-helicase domain-containing protein [Oscillospiraceae bacterium]|nr:UvrD-helicase domain-containing protein [Oscillospiraceae bacterium]
MTQEQNERFIKARRAVIESRFSHLNDMQRLAVLTTQGPLLLLAGAGSGKTTVLINRIANLIKYGRGSDCDTVPEDVTEDDVVFLEGYLRSQDPEDEARADRLCAVEPVEPWRIIAITFTNKAADELKQRLENMLGPEANDIWAMTFHSACVRMLRRDIDRLGFDRSFTIYDTADSQSLMKRILKELELDEKTFPYRTVLNYISRAKDAMQSPEDFMTAAEKSGDVRRRHIGRAYLEYSKRMKNANALDFDDIILFTVRMLQDNPDVREYYQRKFRYVLIDEYQDTNNLQYLLAQNLAGGYENIFVVGDDDQSIYKFRGATIENILSFESQYKNARTIRLEQNYRSTGHILSASNSVIKNNMGRKGKKLWTEQSMGDKLMLYIAPNEREEAQYVATKILAQRSGGDNWRDCAVLYRTNAQSNQIEYAFKRNGIPYRVVGGTRFFDRAEVKDMLAYLCVINEPSDDLRLLRIVNVPARGIGAKTIESAREIAAREGKPLFEVIKNSQYYPELERSAGKLHQFTNFIDDMREKRESVPLDELYDELVERTGYVRALEQKKTDENITRIENVGELKSNIINYMKENDGGSLYGFLDEIALYTDIDQYDRSADCVVMMTMHSAKGLEFPTVFIVGAEEGIFPSSRSIGEPDEMEEERRLCYVAMTRAKQRLYFTAARQRMLYGRTMAGQVSRFIDEIDEGDIVKPSPTFGFGGEDFEGQDGYFGGGRYGSSRSYGGVTQDRHSYGGGRTYYGQKQKPPAAKKTVKSVSAPPLIELRPGDRIEHKTFGEGLVTMVQNVGGDALLEVACDETGT